MSEPAPTPREIVVAELKTFAQERVAWYGDPTKVSLKKLLGKDVVMLAARGALTADEFVEEAFHALESSSEEGVMGKLWQRTIAKLSSNTLDTGDLTTERDDALWVCELKTQENTTNSASVVQGLRNLKAKQAEAKRPRRGSSIPIKAAFCVNRGPAKDEMRTYDNPSPQDMDLKGFEYRYIVGSSLWEWLTGFETPQQLLGHLDDLDVAAIRAARAACLARLKKEMADALSERKLGDSISDVLRLLSPAQALEAVEAEVEAAEEDSDS